ncbi:MAG: hypothetical protein V2J20_08300 [Wenzhouxiangella sp.]|jgi:hypothetical protein|nr:hypothetical protein [Wenzhouxiangella sp.]
MKTRMPVLKKLTLALTIAGSLAVAGSALAQEPADPVTRLSERLELTAAQQAEIQEMFIAHRQNMRQSTRENRSERRQARAGLREEIRAVLDDEQVLKFDEMARRAGPAGRGERGQGPHEKGGQGRQDRPRGNS